MAAILKPLFLGIAGGTAGGKSTLTAKLLEALGPARACCILVDSYYRAQHDTPLSQRALVNYDHPDSLEFDLLLSHLEDLSAGRPVEVPVYSYADHDRTSQTTLVKPLELIIIEGILALYPPELRKFYNYAVFVDAPEQVRFERRLERDTKERGRTPESVHQQWKATVEPMHRQFCEPGKRIADLVVNGLEPFDQAVPKILSVFAGLLRP
jgi:uridine kinase